MYAYFLCLQLLFDVCMLGILWSEYCRRRLQPIVAVKINIIKRVSAECREKSISGAIHKIFDRLTGLGVLVTNILVNSGPRVLTMSPLGTETRWKYSFLNLPVWANFYGLTDLCTYYQYYYYYHYHYLQTNQLYCTDLTFSSTSLEEHASSVGP